MHEWTDRVSSKIKKRYEWFEPEKTVLEYLKQYQNILEIGSGLGRYERLIPRVVGLEYSRHFIEYCINNVKGIFLRADGFNIPIKDSVFDCVFSSGVIEHFDNPIDIVREHIRVCKTGGVIIITVPAKDTPDYQRHRIWQKFLAAKEETSWHYHGRRIGNKELKSLLERAGLADIKLFHLGTPLRGSISSVLRFLKTFFADPSVDIMKGAILEVVGRIISSKLFRFLTSDWFFRKYMKTKGHYLFSKSSKINSPKIQNVEIEIRSYEDLYNVLICPNCHRDLHREQDFLICHVCYTKYPIRSRVPFLTIDDGIKT